MIFGHDILDRSAERIVCWDRRRDILIDESGVLEKYGVRPESIPDWLALVGDAADGIPGIPGWGAKSTATVLSRFEHIETIPDDPGTWDLLSPGRVARLAENLTGQREEALLYRRLATLRKDVPLQESLADLEWQGAREQLRELCRELGDEKIPERVSRWR